MNRFCLKFIIKIISFYRLFISPQLPFACRYIPTCSEYCLQAYKKWGLIRGTILSLKRIISCHPFAKQKVDEVPKQKNKKNGK